MRTISILCLLLFVGTSSLWAQGKCRYEINDIDKFSQDVMRLTESEVVWRDFYEETFIRCAAVQKNKDRGLLFMNYAAEEYTVEAGDSLMLLMSDKSIVTLTAAEKRVAELYNSKIFVGKVYYPLSREQFNQFLGLTVLTVRQYHNGGYHEVDLKDKKQDVIKHLMGCVSDEGS
jgi:hypothetical protein